MKQNSFNALLLALSISVTVTLFWFTFDNADQQFSKLQSKMRELNWLNSQVDSEVLGLRLDRVSNYDQLSNFERELGRMSAASFADIQWSGQGHRGIHVDFDAVVSQLRQKVELTNDFKSDHAVVKNALAGFLHNIQVAMNRDDIDEQLKRQLSELEVAGHQYNLLGTLSTQSKFKQEIAQLNPEAQDQTGGLKTRKTIELVSRNASKLAELRTKLDSTIDRLVQIPIVDTTDMVLRSAEADYQQIVLVRQRYSQYLFISLSILIAFCIGQCVSLRRKSKELSQANDQLEKRVKERTDMLQEALDELSILNAENEQLAAVAKYTDNAVVITDANGRIEWVNDGFERCTGYNQEEVVGKFPGKLLQGPDTDQRTVEQMRKQLSRQQGFDVEVLNYTKHGKPYWVAIEVRPIVDCDGKIRKFIAIESDITERIQSQQERERLSSELQLAARHAGMAEVATGVLHNVGNVLNSVNVSSNLMMEKLKTSSMSMLSKATDVIVSKKSELGEFLTEDSQGRNFPTLLEQVTRTLEQENESQLSELEDLMKNISHIKEIVAMQQSFARQSGTTESLNPVDLMDDALNIIASGFERHDIKVLKDYRDNIVPVLVKKHEVLQILVNLIKNAKQAVNKAQCVDKQVKLRVSSDERFVRFEIQDNGVGIPEKNAEKIFQHGFTTKTTGHGFGLHSCAISAQDMGGSLSFHSDGEGQGSTFQLSLPIQLESCASG